MLYLYVIMLVITGYSVYSLTVKKPIFTITDSKYDYPNYSSFTHQNCKLDGTCWIKSDNANGMPNIHNSKLSRNYLRIANPFKTVKLPNIYYKPNFGNGIII